MLKNRQEMETITAAEGPEIEKNKFLREVLSKRELRAVEPVKLGQEFDV